MKKNCIFRKTTKVQCVKKESIQNQTLRKKSLKSNKSTTYAQKNSTIHQIITNLQKNVKDLKKYEHQNYLKKTRSSYSCINVNNFQESRKTLKKNKSLKKLINQKESAYQRQSVCKSGCQNGSTMISIHSGDIQQVKKAYFNIYGRHNSNIVDLYNFYRKNIQKSTRILGSMQISNFPQAQLSLVKEESNNKQQRRLSNVVVQINQLNKEKVSSKLQKQNIFQQIFKRGSSDLINAGQIIKKRPSNGYFKRNLKIQKTDDRISSNNQIKESANVQKNHSKFRNQIKQKEKIKPISPCKINKNESFQDCLKFQKSLQNLKCQKSILKQKSSGKKDLSQIKQKQNSQRSKTASQKKQYKVIESSNKKSSTKKSFLNQRIDKLQRSQTSIIKNQDDLKSYVNDFFLFPQKQSPEQNGKIKQTKDRSQLTKKEVSKIGKYYISPQRNQKKGIKQLQDCSISFKESPRIIDLDFIPLDL